MNSIMNSDQGFAKDWCWQYCHSSQMDKSIDDWVDPCSAEIWEEPRDEYHHYDHHDDHHDDHRDDGNDGAGQLWTILMSSSVDNVSFEVIKNGHEVVLLRY